MSDHVILTIDEYVKQFSPEIQIILNKLRKLVHEAAPEATEKICYRMPTFFFHENLVHFAAYEKHIGFYPSSSGIEAFKAQLTPYKWSKGAVQFKLSQPIPYPLIEQMVRFRVNEVLMKFKEEQESYGNC
ncbi:MAG: DUF1801 domain-containing protein [Clostridia bacterium]|nr:DUF1801 domain-containing protein [Clostridia bacterium]